MDDGNQVAALRAADTPAQDGSGYDGLMSLGAQLHAEGRLEPALQAFESARVLRPRDVDAASATATLLSLLQRPRAAYAALLSVAPQLMLHADGAANLAIAAEACKDAAQAEESYSLALQLDPDHPRALNNVALHAALASRWEAAIALARRCVALQPAEASHQVNLCEYLMGARRYNEAREALASALLQFPGNADLQARDLALLAFQGELDACDRRIDQLDPSARQRLQQLVNGFESLAFLRDRPFATDGMRPEVSAPRAFGMFLDQAFRHLSICDWRHKDTLTRVMASARQDPAIADQPHDWGDAPFYGIGLGLDEALLRQLASWTFAAMARHAAPVAPVLPAFTASRHAPARKTDGRIHIGVSLQSLAQPRHRGILRQLLAAHDTSRFALHVYAFTHQPDPSWRELLAPHAASVNELGHMSTAEATARIRLDELDLHMQMSFDTAWQQREITALRVAPVQVQHPGWFAPGRSGPVDYVLSDTFAQYGIPPEGDQGAVCQLPVSCWLASDDGHLGGPASSRDLAGLPEERLLLCSLTTPAALDSASFAVWMQILRKLPDALLWLPYCSATSANLVREASAAGVGADRLLFTADADPHAVRASVRHADLVIDTLRFNCASGLEDALRLHVPALTCAGQGMASRLSGSLLRAAGLPQCVLDTPQAYVAEVTRLGRNPSALRELRTSLPRILATAPLFDMRARVADLETAWQAMVDRSRAGLAPASFAVALRGFPPSS